MFYLHTSFTDTFTDNSDFSSRVLINDFFVNSWYLLWTSSWYIPLFVLFITFFTYVVLVDAPKTLTWLVTIFLILLTHSLYQNTNTNVFTQEIAGENFNTLLGNSINKFHPALFYFSLLLLVNLIILKQSRLSMRFGNSLVIKSRHLCIVQLLTVIIFTLFLGSWWAAQEGSWGGWWNWDASEVFGLLVMLAYLNLSHNHVLKSWSNTNSWKHQLLLKGIILTYVFIQFNFDLVSHNFGTRVDHFIDTSHNFLFLIFLIVVTFYLDKLNFSYIYAYNKLIRSSLTPYVLKWVEFVLYATLIYVLVSSFNVLLNDFLWKILHINVLNNTVVVEYFSYLTLSTFIVRLWSPQIVPLIYTLVVWMTVSSVIILLLATSWGLNSIFHMSILAFLISACEEHNHLLSCWELLYESTSIGDYINVTDFGNFAITLNNFFVELSTSTLNNGLLLETPYNVFWSSSSAENHSFTHPLTDVTSHQILLSGDLITRYAICVKDTPLVSTSLITICLFVFAKKLIGSKRIIIF